jgi:hypothetical protein
MIAASLQEQWNADSLEWRGMVLIGKFAHWCNSWDGLPVDETTTEFAWCDCYDLTDEVKAIREQLRDEVRKHRDAVCGNGVETFPTVPPHSPIHHNIDPVVNQFTDPE